MRKSSELTNISTTEADELRIMVCELNESIAYLSKMVLQLQKSIDSSKPQRAKEKATDNGKPKTVH